MAHLYWEMLILLYFTVILRPDQEMENFLTGSGLKAMDGIYCLVLYNLQTSVLSTTAQRMKLLSKYTARKQRRRANPPVTSRTKVVAQNGKTKCTHCLPKTTRCSTISFFSKNGSSLGCLNELKIFWFHEWNAFVADTVISMKFDDFILCLGLLKSWGIGHKGHPDRRLHVHSHMSDIFHLE